MITEKQAINFSKIKWKHAWETGCMPFELNAWLEKNHPEIDQCKAGCGLCERYIHLKGFRDCSDCPLYKLWGINCFHPESVYIKWLRADTVKERKKYARRIYKDIQKIEEGMK